MKYYGLCIAAIEWYDSALCLSLVSVLSTVFFPQMDVVSRFLFYFSSFVIGYFGRPIGAVIFGWYSDRKSRFAAVYFALSLMVSVSLFIGCLPSYASIGIAATIAFVFLRFLQGVAIGGNFGVSVVSVETAPEGEKYYTSSVICCGFMLGFLLGDLVVYAIMWFLPVKEFLQFGWRLPFLIGFIAGLPVLMKLKQCYREMSECSNCNEPEQKVEFSIFVKAFCLLLLDMVPFYLFFAFLPNFRVMFLMQDPLYIRAMHVLSMFTMMIMSPIFGRLADKYGAITMLKYVCGALITMGFFVELEGPLWSIMQGVVMAACYGSLYGILALIFPKKIRARMSSIVLNVASITCGAGLPIIAMSFVGNGIPLGLLLIASTIIALIALLTLKRVR